MGFPDVKPGPVAVNRADTTFEKHYSIGDLAVMWRLSRESVRLLVKDELGVVKMKNGPKKAMVRYSVPESVARRIHTRLSSGG
jgi:hypothetical protein